MKKAVVIILSIVALAAVVVSAMWGNDIGLTENGMVEAAQAKTPGWESARDIDGRMAAMLFYDDTGDYSISLYVNRPGFSFGWFFRYGGNTYEAQAGIVEFYTENIGERAFLSLNADRVERAEIDTGTGTEVVSLDSGKPFAVVLPADASGITFYDVDGEIVEPFSRKI